jgi:hypothetical protein
MMGKDKLFFSLSFFYVPHIKLARIYYLCAIKNSP